MLIRKSPFLSVSPLLYLEEVILELLSVQMTTTSIYLNLLLHTGFPGNLPELVSFP